MNFKTLGRLAGVLAVTAGLAGCIDVNAEIEVLSETTGKATTTMTMSSEFYPMVKQMAAAGGDDSDDAESEAGSDFCTEADAVLTENADGSATCVSTKQGDFKTITEGDGGSPNEDTTFTVVSPGVVRVVFKTSEMKSQVTEGSGGGQSAEDAQALAMIKPYFEGHSIAIKVKGKRITDTNMTLAGDGSSAETTIPFTDLLSGSASIPDELYAVVDTN